MAGEKAGMQAKPANGDRARTVVTALGKEPCEVPGAINVLLFELLQGRVLFCANESSCALMMYVLFCMTVRLQRKCSRKGKGLTKRDSGSQTPTVTTFEWSRT